MDKNSKPTSRAVSQRYRSTPRNASCEPSKQSRSVMLRPTFEPIPIRQENGMLIPEGYSMRPVRPAEKAELISMARAMNDDFPKKVRKLFQDEVQAALNAINTGLYAGYRCPEFNWDCIRVFTTHKCFCGHLLNEHTEFDGRKHILPCKQCKCKAYAFIPSRPEDVGEFWYQRRRGFDVSQYRVKCRCKHTHEQHDPNSKHCLEKGCGCFQFNSNFLCASCDKHWEEHQTFFETEKERLMKKMPCGNEYIPFHELPELKNMVLTGQEDHYYGSSIEMMPRSSITHNQNDPVVLRKSARKF